jgi:hypothetical protein
MEKLKIIVLFIVSSGIIFAGLMFGSIWAMCTCLFNYVQSGYIFLAPLLGSALVVYFARKQQGKGKSLLLYYGLFLLVTLFVLKAIQFTLMPVSDFLEKKFPFLSPQRAYIMPSIPTPPLPSYASSTGTIQVPLLEKNQVDTFIDPELRYKLVIPIGMVYKYDKESKSLNIWSKKDHNERVEFSITYLSPEEQKDLQPLTEQEKNRSVTLKTKESISIYDPYITEACHEEGSVPLKSGGALQFYGVCGNDELRTLFDKVISNTEILK